MKRLYDRNHSGPYIRRPWCILAVIALFLSACILIYYVYFSLKLEINYSREELDILRKHRYISSTNVDVNVVVKIVKDAQKMAGLPVTGVMDSSTMEFLKGPRCVILTKDSRYYQGPWTKPSIKVCVEKEINGTFVNNTLLDNVSKCTAEASRKWQKFSGLDILTENDCYDNNYDVAVFTAVQSDNLGLKELFGNGSTNILAVYSPPDGTVENISYGRIFINPYIDWKTMSEENNSTDLLFATVIHEMGHALGLNHTTIKESVMYEKPYVTFLHEDDIYNIEQLYKHFKVHKLKQ